MNKLIESVLQWVFPNLCVCCSSYLAPGEKYICMLCEFQLPKFESYAQKDNAVAKTFWGRQPFVHAMSYFKLESKSPVHKIIHEIKYGNKPDLGRLLGVRLGELMHTYPGFSDVYGIIAIPLHPKKELQRGYNQSDLIAEGIAESMKVRRLSKVITRVTHSSTQTKKNRLERWENVSEIFQLANINHLKGKHLVLVDDVITTGATIDACATVLRKIENVKLSVVSLAFTS